jgi:hypothetical protein
MDLLLKLSTPVNMSSGGKEWPIKEIVNVVENIMKNLLGLIVIILALVGCTKRDTNGALLLKDRVPGDNELRDNPYVEVIDSCEYIVWGIYLMAHKGNCKFCAARRDVVPGPPVEEDYGKDKKY